MRDGPLPGNAPEARAWALRHHGDQRYGDLPYSAHLDDVAALVEPWGPGAVVVAYLHDVVEDTPVGLEDVSDAFGPWVAACVDLVTDPPGPNRRARKDVAAARWTACPPEFHAALVVKAADRLANLRACVRDGRTRLLSMYRSEHEAFRLAVYRPELCEPLWSEIEAVFRQTSEP
jgi:(p)ppGpp synthase/HD superfamily hydrolase